MTQAGVYGTIVVRYFGDNYLIKSFLLCFTLERRNHHFQYACNQYPLRYLPYCEFYKLDTYDLLMPIRTTCTSYHI